MVGPVGIMSLKFEARESGCFSENEIVNLKCTVTGNTLLTVYDPGENAVGAGMGEVEIPVNTSLAKDGIYKCRAVGENSKKELEFCVRGKRFHSFFIAEIDFLYQFKVCFVRTQATTPLA